MPSVETFFAAWSEVDDAARSDMMKTVVSEEIVYADPRTEEALEGLGAVAEYVGMFAKTAAGATASVIKYDAHHGIARVTVEFKMPDGRTQHGQYFVQPSGDAPIQRMIGFVGTGAPE